MKEDPRELARRLAEEAKQRHLAPPAATGAEDPRELARRLAEQAKQRIEQGPPAPAAPMRPMSAKEALAKARAERSAAPQTQPQMPMPAEDEPWAAPDIEGGVDLEPTMPIPGGAAVSVGRLITELMPHATVVEQTPIENIQVFRALWRAHLARAREDRNMPLASLASVLLDAIDRLDPGQLVAVRVAIDAVQWAAWVDVSREVLLGVAQPVDVYLPAT